MIKHVGRHNNKRVVIAYRQVPDEDHMCLVIYSETLRSHSQSLVRHNVSIKQFLNEINQSA